MMRIHHLFLALLGLMLLPVSPAVAGPPLRGNPAAPVGGLYRDRFPVPPAKLHPLNATDLYANTVLDRIYESPAQVDVETLEHLPSLAERWEISADKLHYTFHLNPKATWQDGRPVSAEDFRFSFEALFHPTLRTRAKWQAYYSNFTRAEVLDAGTVRFTARGDHFRNLVNIAGLRIVPRHKFGVEDLNKTTLSKQPLGSGPYRFEKWARGNFIRLKRHEGYWGAALPQNRGRNNFGRWMSKVIATDKVALESLKKGDIDTLKFTAQQWMLETNGPEFSTDPKAGKKLIKLDVVNQAPRSYRYVGWNLSSPLFSDKRVRRAMSHLFDRKTIIDKFYHGLDGEAVGPFQANSRYTSPKVVPIRFSIPRAIALMKEAGWADNDGDRVVDKAGRAFRFTVMTADAEVSVKILTLTKEVMRKAGVDMAIKVVDWSTLLSLIDDYRFDAVMLGWSRTPWPDPTALWHSKSAVAGGLNLVRYKNPAVDALIDAAVGSIPDTERIRLYRSIHEILHEDQPYAFLTEVNHTLLGYQARLRSYKPWYAYEVGTNYWWFASPTR